MLAIAYRGYGGSTGKPTETGLTEDARAAYAWLAHRTPASSIIIHGHSLGAAVAVRLAADHPARALVLESPFTSAVDLGEGRLPGLPVRWLMLDRYPSRDLIGQVGAPVLVVHGDADEVIPFRMGQALFALAKGPKRFVRIHGGGHNDLWSLGLHGHIEQFLAATAPPTLPPGGERP